jgi:hypothetical protein
MMIVEYEINGREVLENASPKYPVDVLVVPNEVNHQLQTGGKKFDRSNQS